MDRQRGSSSRAPSPLPGDWRRCSVLHNELVKLQAGGYLPPAFMVPVRAGLATYKGGKQAEVYPKSQQRGAGMLRPLSDKGARISCTSIPPWAPGVLRTPASSPHARLNPAYCGLRSSLRAIPGRRAPLRTVEEVVLPCTPLSRGVHISSGRRRNMAHCRDRISIRNP